MDYQLHQRVIVWLEQAAEMLIQSFDRDIHVEEKQNARDLVTEMDRAIENFFLNNIRTYYPDHQVLGEEGLSDDIVSTKGFLWIIDPIDGTLNFVKMRNQFGILIGLYYDGKPLAGYIMDVMRHDLYYGIIGDGVYLNHKPLEPIDIESLSDALIVGNIFTFVNNRFNSQEILHRSLGHRAYGSAAHELISVIRGEAGAYIANYLHPWDFAAGLAILSEMGYRVTTMEGEEINILERQPLIFAHPNVYDELLEIVQRKD